MNSSGCRNLFWKRAKINTIAFQPSGLIINSCPPHCARRHVTSRLEAFAAYERCIKLEAGIRSLFSPGHPAVTPLRHLNKNQIMMSLFVIFATLEAYHRLVVTLRASTPASAAVTRRRVLASPTTSRDDERVCRASRRIAGPAVNYI